MMNRPIFRFLATLLLLTAGLFARGDEAAAGDMRIRSIGYEFSGAARQISEDALTARIKIKEGDLYEQSDVSDSIKALYATGLFDSIKVKTASPRVDLIDVVFDLRYKVNVTGVKFEGNRRFSSRKLMKVVNDEDDIENPNDFSSAAISYRAQLIREFYYKKGHPFVKVNYVVEFNESDETFVAKYTIDEESNVHIGRIRFEGVEPLKSADLEDLMTTKKKGLLSFFTGSGKFIEDQFHDDLEVVRGYIADQGYLDAMIKEDEIQFDYPAKTRVNISIPVELGKQYTTGVVTVSGNELFDMDKVKEILLVKEGETYSPSRVSGSDSALRRAYGEQGYLGSQVNIDKNPNLESGEIDLDISIREGDRHYVDSIKVSGNTKTQTRVIARELALQPGDIFDSVRMESSQARLQNTRYFDEVIVVPEATSIPNRDDLAVSVTEGKTASAGIEGALSNVESFTIALDFTQSNFDYKNYKNWFQGAGQKFNGRVQFGSKSHSYNISFEEPWLFDRQLAFGWNAYHTQSKYVSDLYNEEKLGANFYFSKRLFELFRGTLSYSIELAKMKDISAKAPDVIKNEKFDRTISKVGFVVNRDTTDNPVLPQSGSMFRISNYVAGGPFGGNTDYYKVDGLFSYWHPVNKRWGHTLQLSTRVGAISPFNGDEIPFYERYFLGGPETLRGFKYREVGPKSADSTREPLGGRTMYTFSTEYTVRVMEQFYLAAFYDFGVLNSKEFNFDPSDYNDNWGFGARILVLGSPLRVDFGFPLKADKHNRRSGPVPQFSFGFHL